jgi:hypothetical protein
MMWAGHKSRGGSHNIVKASIRPRLEAAFLHSPSSAEYGSYRDKRPSMPMHRYGRK